MDVMAKSLGQNKRQIMYLLYILMKFIRLKMNPTSCYGKQIFILSGRAHPQSQDSK